MGKGAFGAALFGVAQQEQQKSGVRISFVFLRVWPRRLGVDFRSILKIKEKTGLSIWRNGKRGRKRGIIPCLPLINCLPIEHAHISPGCHLPLQKEGQTKQSTQLKQLDLLVPKAADNVEVDVKNTHTRWKRW